ncbi:uncharacterized protein PFL1_03374 [Pseudozyma flocculosa PF-1]|uniref:Related to Protein GET1 n=2 Tax=Pseudozyma flocculosa TaxID=84751 RepID=A0A5C3F9M7_9BASI|nr:uncharacterized protein PFL1_03374 [Pseudozyma flocculosa PF-1]EPQ29085.1 hypothetical protein PFL1_03374 [Pseudozyma flocculosa PF-1]SPO40079.1 related to Protein GET1 [Pseudozyma flocculosa]
MHPALVILVAVLFVQSISVLGKERLQEVTYAIYVRILHRSTLAEQRRLRTEVFTNKQQLAKTSSQDEFAKWAKLRRKVDKGLQDLEKTNGTLSSSRTTFSLLFKALMFGLTTVLPFLVTSYYSKTPIFWIPPAGLWFGPLGWFLSLPRAPAGSISSTMWQMVCTRALISILSSLKSLLPVKQVEPVIVTPAQGSGQTGAAAAANAEKPTPSPSSASRSEPTSAASRDQARPGARRRAAHVDDAANAEL